MAWRGVALKQATRGEDRLTDVLLSNLTLPTYQLDKQGNRMDISTCYHITAAPQPRLLCMFISRPEPLVSSTASMPRSGFVNVEQTERHRVRGPLRCAFQDKAVIVSCYLAAIGRQ